MACAKPSNCAPCSKCPPTPEPVVPRCNGVVLTDGTYSNATVVIEDGCIISVEAGTLPVYTPDSCCATPGGEGGGGSGSGVDGDQGPPGQNATINIGTVASLPYGSAPTVTNSGTATNAVLDFGIPRGQPGEDGETPTGASSAAGGIELVNGAIKTPLPVAWPPVLIVDFVPSPVAGVLLSAAKNPVDGSVMLTVDLTAYNVAIQGQLSSLQGYIDALEARVDALEAASADHESRITALEPP